MISSLLVLLMTKAEFLEPHKAHDPNSIESNMGRSEDHTIPS